MQTALGSLGWSRGDFAEAHKAWREQFPLRARGRKLENQRGEHFKLAGVNWYGASDAFHVVGGLDVRSLADICEAVSAMGFTVVRLPFSNEMLRKETDVPLGVIDYALNPDLEGLRPIEVFDKVIDGLGDVGVAVILNNHTTCGMWSGGADTNGLWYQPGDAQYTEENWVKDWLWLAARYRDKLHVIGYDLRNEVRPTTYLIGAGPAWNEGEESLDWARAAGCCARALVGAGAPGIIVVERICWPQAGVNEMLYPEPPWQAWGVPRDRIVLAVHMYSWSGPGSWSPKAFTGGVTWTVLSIFDYIADKSLYGEFENEDLHDQMEHEWGFCLDQNVCPVWLSEFGCNLNDEYEMEWFRRVCAYLRLKDADFAYWPLNVGPKSEGGDESYGLLTNTWHPRWFDARLRCLRELIPSISSGAVLAQRSLPWRQMVESLPACAPAPWCAPLPGPLLQWPVHDVDEAHARNLQLPSVAMRSPLPRAKYLLTPCVGQDADAGEPAFVEQIAAGGDGEGMLAAVENLARTCFDGGYGGFTVRNGQAKFWSAPAESLRQRLLSAPQDSVCWLLDEVRLCAVWTVGELNAADEEEQESPADELADNCVDLQHDGLVEVCQRRCVAHDYGGFELRPGCAGPPRMLSRSQALQLRRRGDFKGISSQFSATAADSNASTFGSAPRQVHLLDKVLVRIGLEVHPGKDAFPGANAYVLRQATLTECRQRCLERGFRGFALYYGDAYFRTAESSALRQHLRATDGACTFYVLTTVIVPVADLPGLEASSKEAGLGHAAALENVLPRLWDPVDSGHSARRQLDTNTPAVTAASFL